jgi:hypothetical protein
MLFRVFSLCFKGVSVSQFNLKPKTKMSANSSKSVNSLPFTVNQAAVAQFMFETPKAISENALTKAEKTFLLSLGLSDEFPMRRFPVLGTSSAKTEKGEAMSYLTGICYLSPASESGFANLCFWAKNCKALCLNTAGRGAFGSVQHARRVKTARLCYYGVETFLLNAVLDVRKIAKQAQTKGFKVAIRLDGTSDLNLANHPIQSLGNQSLVQLFPEIEFYEYTKSFQRMVSFLNREFPCNFHLTFSLDGETNRKSAEIILAKGGNVAACFEGALPESFMGVRVLDGDKSDLRFLDAISPFSTGYVIGLTAKGKAKTLRNGFVQVA